MPELPEVETIRLGLTPAVVGRMVSDVDVRHERVSRRQPGGSVGLARGLLGRRVVSTGRRGKALWLTLDDGTHWVVHLGMSGQMRLPSPVDSSRDDPHLRVRVAFADDGPVVVFRDQRTFGWMSVSEATRDDPSLPGSLADLARDPIDPRFDPEAVVRRWASSNVAIKRLLLNQRVVSGIGNIYADEILWRTGVHWATPARMLPVDTARVLLRHASELLTEAVNAGGTSFDGMYVDVLGSAGRFGERLCVYGREGRPCPGCGAGIVRERFDGRSSHRCPTCQPERLA